jgi:hydrogenase maturation factor
MTAVATDFNDVLVDGVSAMVAAILLIISDGAAAHRMSAFVIVFHRKKTSLDFKCF